MLKKPSSKLNAQFELKSKEAIESAVRFMAAQEILAGWGARLKDFGGYSKAAI
jgi:hypothetical protein